MKVPIKPVDRSTARSKDLQAELQDWRDQLDRAMADYFASGEAKAGLGLGIHEKTTFKKLQEFSQRPGKRIRGGLAAYSYRSFGGKNKDTERRLAVAIELIQNYFLIIDDVMDRSDFRRGKPATHKLFRKELATKLVKEEADHIGDMLAINTGLLAEHMASMLIADTKEDPRNIVKATKIFHRNTLATCYGQVADLYNNILGNPGKSYIIHLHQLKNSYYTFINPLQTGAALAGQTSPKLMDHLLEIGLPAGVGFQLQDDVLGLFGESKVTGKPALDDLKEGRFTLLMHYAFKKASRSQLKVLSSALGNPKVTEAQHRAVKQIAIDTGAKQAVEEAAQSYCAQAQAEIASSRVFDDNSKRFLHDLIEYCVNRKA